MSRRKICLSDWRGRSAEVLMFSCCVKRQKVYRDADNKPVRFTRLVRGTAETGFRALYTKYGDPETFVAALIDSDPEIDCEAFGGKIERGKKVFLDPENSPLYALNMLEVIYNRHGEEKERRRPKNTPANLISEPPPKWSGKYFSGIDAVRRFASTRNYQLRHIDGLTYDYLYSIAVHLQRRDKLVLIGSGHKGVGPLIMERNGVPHYGLLEGKVDGGSYMLILHLSSHELITPENGDEN